MKKGILLLTVLYVVGIFTSTLVNSAVPGFPKMVLSKDSWDFGTISEGQVVTHVFRISNIGEAELLIDSVTPVCDCTVANISANIIPSGGKAELKVIFNSKGNTGSYKSFVMISSNDPEWPVKRITISGKIVAIPR
jgi:Protein of unknown function (DUF1573)